jgi:predicted dehydrogenase
MSTTTGLRLGIVGTGGWARSFWSKAAECPDVKTVACWDPSADAAERFAEGHGCEAAPTLEALLGRSDVEAIANFAPNAHHRGPTELAAAAGMHVFTEKPIANTIEDGAAMIRACREAGVVLMVGHSSRYSGRSRALRSVIESGRLGALAMAEGHISHSGGLRLSRDAWRWHRDDAPGGPLIQLAVHTFDTMHYLFGPTRRAAALSSGSLTSSEIEDAFLCLLEFESGLLAYVGTNYVCPAAGYLRIYGVGGNAYAEGGEVAVVTTPDEPWKTESESIAVPALNEPAAEMAEFARAVRAGDRPETAGEEGLLALAVVRACLESAERGRPVEIAEVLGEDASLLR